MSAMDYEKSPERTPSPLPIIDTSAPAELLTRIVPFVESPGPEPEPALEPALATVNEPPRARSKDKAGPSISKSTAAPKSNAASSSKPKGVKKPQVSAVKAAEKTKSTEKSKSAKKAPAPSTSEATPSVLHPPQGTGPPRQRRASARQAEAIELQEIAAEEAAKEAETREALAKEAEEKEAKEREAQAKAAEAREAKEAEEKAAREKEAAQAKDAQSKKEPLSPKSQALALAPLHPVLMRPFPVQPVPRNSYTAINIQLPLFDKEVVKAPARKWDVSLRKIRTIAGGRVFLRTWTGERTSRISDMVSEQVKLAPQIPKKGHDGSSPVPSNPDGSGVDPIPAAREFMKRAGRGRGRGRGLSGPPGAGRGRKRKIGEISGDLPSESGTPGVMTREPSVETEIVSVTGDSGFAGSLHDDMDIDVDAEVET